MDSEEQDQVRLTDIFSLNKPKDIKAGIASGLKSLGKGILGGSVGLIAAPFMGAATGGVAGFAKGVATGVAGAVLLPATGVSVAVVQVTRGFINQSEAFVESYKGKVWDQSSRSWVEQSFTALTRWTPRAGSWWQQERGLPGFNEQLDFYQLLQVPRDASPAEIKRQFYILARRHHPDKNAGDADAHLRFQQLSQSYQVLINPHLRAQYDRQGAAGLDGDFIEGAAFYTALFGSERFDHLVGELAIATLSRSVEGLTAAELQQVQSARVTQLTAQLTALLKTFVEGDEAGFKVAMQQECKQLSATSFGVPLLHCIGRVYHRQSSVVLGGWWGGLWARLQHSQDVVRAHLNVAGAAVKVLSHQERMKARERQVQQRQQQREQGGASSSYQQQQMPSVECAASNTQGQQQQQQQQCCLSRSLDPAEAIDAFWFGGTCSSSSSGGGLELNSSGSSSVPQMSFSNRAAHTKQCDPQGPGAGPQLRPPATPPQPQHCCLHSQQHHPECQQQLLEQHDRQQGRAAAASTSSSSPGIQHQEGGSAACATPPAGRGGDGGGGGAAAAAAPNDASAADCSVTGNVGDGAQYAQPAANAQLEDLLARAQLEEVSMELCLEAMWAANVVDILNTLSTVCSAVLHDRSISKQLQQRRALALRELGAIFQSAATAAGSTANQQYPSAKQRIQAVHEALIEKQMAEQEKQWNDDDVQT